MVQQEKNEDEDISILVNQHIWTFEVSFLQIVESNHISAGARFEKAQWPVNYEGMRSFRQPIILTSFIARLCRLTLEPFSRSS